MLDGELIAPGTNAPDNFTGAMARFSGNKEQPISYRAFDIISYKSESIARYPIEERKGLLTEVVSKIDSEHINLVPYVHTEGLTLFNVIKENNMEGIIAKRLGSSYVPGTRSDNWRKIINWSYHDCIVSKVSTRPLTVQLQSIDGDYLGSISIGFTKEIRAELHSKQVPFSCKVKARGLTSGEKLRLPQIVSIN